MSSEEREYEVLSGNVFGKDAGEKVKLSIPEPQRSQLIEGGAIKDLSGEGAVETVEPSHVSNPDELTGAVKTAHEEEEARLDSQRNPVRITEPETPASPEESANEEAAKKQAEADAEKTSQEQAAGSGETTPSGSSGEEKSGGAGSGTPRNRRS